MAIGIVPRWLRQISTGDVPVVPTIGIFAKLTFRLVPVLKPAGLPLQMFKIVKSMEKGVGRIQKRDSLYGSISVLNSVGGTLDLVAGICHVLTTAKIVKAAHVLTVNAAGAGFMAAGAVFSVASAAVSFFLAHDIEKDVAQMKDGKVTPELAAKVEGRFSYPRGLFNKLRTEQDPDRLLLTQEDVENELKRRALMLRINSVVSIILSASVIVMYVSPIGLPFLGAAGLFAIGLGVYDLLAEAHFSRRIKETMQPYAAGDSTQGTNQNGPAAGVTAGSAIEEDDVTINIEQAVKPTIEVVDDSITVDINQVAATVEGV